MYDFVDGLGILGEDVIEDLVEVVLLGCEVFVVFLHAVDESLGDDFTFPGGKIDGLY